MDMEEPIEDDEETNNAALVYIDMENMIAAMIMLETFQNAVKSSPG